MLQYAALNSIHSVACFCLSLIVDWEYYRHSQTSLIVLSKKLWPENWDHHISPSEILTLENTNHNCCRQDSDFYSEKIRLHMKCQALLLFFSGKYEKKKKKKKKVKMSATILNGI